MIIATWARTYGVRKSITTNGVAHCVARYMANMTQVVNSFPARIAGQSVIAQQTVNLSRCPMMRSSRPIKTRLG